MTLINSRNCPMRAPHYTVGASRPECLNPRTSPVADSLNGCGAALLDARQTASLITAQARSNVYLDSASGPRRDHGYENRAVPRGAVTESALW
jgi:hypothetical protein